LLKIRGWENYYFWTYYLRIITYCHANSRKGGYLLRLVLYVIKLKLQIMSMRSHEKTSLYKQTVSYCGLNIHLENICECMFVLIDNITKLLRKLRKLLLLEENHILYNLWAKPPAVDVYVYHHTKTIVNVYSIISSKRVSSKFLHCRFDPLYLCKST